MRPQKTRQAGAGLGRRALKTRPRGDQPADVRTLLDQCPVCGVTSGPCVKASKPQKGRPIAEPHPERRAR